MAAPGIQIRKANTEDVPRLREIIEASVRGLQAGDYSPAQIESALQFIYGVDSQLISDGTYFVAESSAGLRPATEPPGRRRDESIIVACGGWSKRRTLYGGDQFAGRQDSLLNPAQDAAKIRAFFVHPDWARRGIGSMILNACERAAAEAGFRRLEMGSTLSGIPFYRARGYAEIENQEVPMNDGTTLPVVRMAKNL
jgi:GNAT superfamily N-acetyltransferase